MFEFSISNINYLNFELKQLKNYLKSADTLNASLCLTHSGTTSELHIEEHAKLIIRTHS